MFISASSPTWESKELLIIGFWSSNFNSWEIWGSGRYFPYLNFIPRSNWANDFSFLTALFQKYCSLKTENGWKVPYELRHRLTKAWQSSDIGHLKCKSTILDLIPIAKRLLSNQTLRRYGFFWDGWKEN